MQQTTMGQRLTRWKTSLSFNTFIILHITGKNNILIDILLRIYEERTANSVEELTEDLTINKFFSAFTFQLTLSLLDNYSPCLHPDYTSNNVIFSSPVLTYDPDCCHYQQQPDTMTAISGIIDYQAFSSFSADKGCNQGYQES
jgi:hypothetical protein